MNKPAKLLVLCAILCGLASCKKNKTSMTGLSRPTEAAARVRPQMEADLTAKGLEFGAPVFIRAFKEEMELELFVHNRKTGKYDLFRTYPIAKASGALGPKLAEGDGQVPEGFYAVPPAAMNPASKYHLAFNIGYPNEFDRALNRTGSAIMIHGKNASIGCLAMTDAKIEEIYTLCAAAHAGGLKDFKVHIFPFRMTRERMSKAAGSKWEDFWKNLREGYDRFEETRVPPRIVVENKCYKFS